MIYIKQEDAVKVAEWLGVMKGCYYSTKDFSSKTTVLWIKRDQGNIGFIPWLISPEGQEALMDKLLAEKKYEVYLARMCCEEVITKIELIPDPPMKVDCISITAPTRQHALLLAVLEMLKGGE